MLITNEQRNIANQLNKMETFSKLRPPDAVRIKAKLLEKKSENCDQYASQDLTSCDESPRTKSSIDTNYRVKQTKKFCVDPLITSYDILFNLISQAFGIKDEFQMSYLNRQNNQLDSTNSPILNPVKAINENNYLALFNDWDLDAAFLNSSQPYLCINIEITPKKYPGNNSESIYDEWEVIHSTESALINKNQLKHIRLNESPKKDQNQNSLALNSLNRSFISNAADKAVSVIQRVFKLTRSNSSQSNSALLSRSNSLTEPDSPVFLFDLNLIEQLVKFKQPLNENEFKNFLDSDGRIVQPQELRQRIFEGGCDPSKRKELWPILLDIFPHQSMTLAERNDFIQQKSFEYENFKSTLWYNSNKFLHRNSSQIVSDSSFDSNFSDESQHLYCLAHKIYKDVWRTDRNHKFYSGDSNKNIEGLFNILMTYTLANPDQPYSQGMSDLLSPLFFVLKDEALSYICFCSLMKRCAHNFEIMSHSMTLKIKLLSSLIQKFDPELWAYLSQVGAEQLLFVYRWLLLECKREFPFNDSLRMFEIMWSSTNTNQIGLKASRSNSNASNISLKLLKNINQKKLTEFLNEDFIEDESDLSQNSPVSINNNNNNCSNCELCDKDDEMTEIETDTDLESINGFNYYNRFRKNRQRVRRLSLNSSFYSHKTARVQKLEPSSLNTNCYLTELKEQQLEEKVGKKSKNKRLLNYLKKKNFKNFSNLTGNNNLSKSNSLSCVNLAQNSTNSLKRSKSEVNLKISYDCRSKKVPILFARKLKSSLMGSSRFSTSEAETLRNSVSKPRPSSTSSDLSDDLNKLKLSRKKTKKRVKIANSSPIRDSDNEFSKNKKKILFRNIKKSLEKSHLKISKKFNMMKVCQHKNSTSSKSSTSAYVSAGSVISSASSIYSACSTPFSEKKPKTPSIPIIRVQQETPNINDSKNFLEEEQLVYELSKLDNPFLLFICFAMFLEHREHIMSNQMDSNDIACFFDKMTRKHNLKNILIRARYLYTKLYLAKVNVFSYIQQLMDIQNSP